MKSALGRFVELGAHRFCSWIAGLGYDDDEDCHVCMRQRHPARVRLLVGYCGGLVVGLQTIDFDAAIALYRRASHANPSHAAALVAEAMATLRSKPKPPPTTVRYSTLCLSFVFSACQPFLAFVVVLASHRCQSERVLFSFSCSLRTMCWWETATHRLLMVAGMSILFSLYIFVRR